MRKKDWKKKDVSKKKDLKQFVSRRKKRKQSERLLGAKRDV